MPDSFARIKRRFLSTEQLQEQTIEKRNIPDLNNDRIPTGDLSDQGQNEQSTIRERHEGITYGAPVPVKTKRTGSSATSRNGLTSPVRLNAVSHNDNREFFMYQRYCVENSAYGIPQQWDVSERYIIRVTDNDENTLPQTRVSILNAQKCESFHAVTPAGGEIVLFPCMDLDKQYQTLETCYIRINNEDAVSLKKPVEHIIAAAGVGKRIIPPVIPVQITFLLDATGSMSDEIQELKDVIVAIHSGIISLSVKPDVSFSVVAYRDRDDEFLVKGYPFTKNIDTFQMSLESIKAGGGGDYPEDVEAGLNYTLDSLRWDVTACKFIFLIADALPHVKKYLSDYLDAARKARGQGIRICPVGASGLTREGEYIFRQIETLTHGEYIFLYYGEQGENEEIKAEADIARGHRYTGINDTVRTLDDIVIGIVSRDLSYFQNLKK
jgi:hypothetical protein